MVDLHRRVHDEAEVGGVGMIMKGHIEPGGQPVARYAGGDVQFRPGPSLHERPQHGHGLCRMTEAVRGDRGDQAHQAAGSSTSSIRSMR